MDKTKFYAHWHIIRLTIILIIAMRSSLGCVESQVNRFQVPDFPPPPPKHTKPIKVALVLSSGGFRGAAHLGAISVLEEHHIPIDLIVGSSAGSFIGAFYADEPNVPAIKTKLMQANFEHLVDTSWFSAVQAPFCPTGPIHGSALQTFMLKNLRARDFQELKIPLVVVTTSMLNNQLEILQSGPIIPAVHASSALPPYFAPVRLYQNQYVDGGVICKVPVSVAKQFKPKFIIAVNISMKPSLSEIKNAFAMTSRALDISFYELARYQAKEADVVIEPEIIGYGSFDDAYHEEFYQAGRKAALAQIDAIKTAVLKIR